MSWCATGAINCATYRHVRSLDIPPALQRVRERAGTILTDTVRALTLGHYRETTTYNDATKPRLHRPRVRHRDHDSRRLTSDRPALRVAIHTESTP